MIPDQTVFKSGGNAQGSVLNLAARSAVGRWLLCYLADDPNVSIDMGKITAGTAVTATWINPASGERLVIGTFSPLGVRNFSRPSGWPDAVLVIK